MRALAWCAGVLVPAALSAQQTFRGVIVSARDGAPVASAEVASRDGSAKVRTSAEGAFRIHLATRDSLVIRALGFRPLCVMPRGADTVKLEPLATTLARVTTTAGMRTIRADEAPASVSVVDAQDIAAVAAASVNQILRTISGVQETPSPPTKSTMSIRGLDGARVLVLVDGEPVPGTLIETRDIGRLSTLAAKRIEVTKGPSSVEFGSDALGGVINLVTADPADAFGGNFMMRAGALGRRESSAELSDTRGPLGYRLSGGWRQSDRIVAVTSEGTTLERVYDGRADMRYRASDRLQLRGDLQLSQERQRWPVGGGYNGFIDNRAGQGLLEAKWRGLGGAVRARVSGLRSAYQFRQSQHSAPIAGTGDSLEQNERNARAMLAYVRAAGSHVIDAGVQWSARSIVAPAKIDGDRASDRIFEVFARDAITIGRLLVIGGGRSTSSSLWGDEFAPSLGVSWQVADNWRIRSSVARGFRAPSFKEIRYTFANPAAGYVLEGNPSLEPERSWNADAAVTWGPARNVAVTLDGYHTDVSNLIDLQLSGNNEAGFQVFRNANVAKARIDGIEAQLRAETRVGELSVAYNYLRARDVENDKSLDRRSPHTARVAYDRAAHVSTHIAAQYIAAAPVGDETQGARLSVDAQVAREVLDRVELSAGVNNAFNARPKLWTPAFDRQLYFGIRARFGGS